jgi:hypothetical protein
MVDGLMNLKEVLRSAKAKPDGDIEKILSTPGCEFLAKKHHEREDKKYENNENSSKIDKKY